LLQKALQDFQWIFDDEAVFVVVGIAVSRGAAVQGVLDSQR
jgi:hypothetical protein